MKEENSKVTNSVRYELIDKEGMLVGDYPTAESAAKGAAQLFPGQTQDEDRTGAGWDIQIAGAK